MKLMRVPGNPRADRLLDLCETLLMHHDGMLSEPERRSRLAWARSAHVEPGPVDAQVMLGILADHLAAPVNPP